MAEVWCVWTEWGEYEQFSRDLRACFPTAELAEQQMRLASLIEWEHEVFEEDWTDLFERGLLREGSDQTGERWPVLTDAGRERLREVAYIIGGILDPSTEEAITAEIRAARARGIEVVSTVDEST